ncbi:MAG TPA: hypothetical protein VHJ59_07380 [Nitrososphaera sp.]|jgi:hypothetical protein|nr:hypothetical protein [Nitrososphaera sp.]
MKSTNNKVGISSTSLLEEADELVRGRNCTRDFALYTMFSQAMAIGDKVRAEACMDLLESEVMNSLLVEV